MPLDQITVLAYILSCDMHCGVLCLSVCLSAKLVDHDHIGWKLKRPRCVYYGMIIMNLDISAFVLTTDSRHQ